MKLFATADELTPSAYHVRKVLGGVGAMFAEGKLVK
jgi:hypothetical protein